MIRNEQYLKQFEDHKSGCSGYHSSFYYEIEVKKWVWSPELRVELGSQLGKISISFDETNFMKT